MKQHIIRVIKICGIKHIIWNITFQVQHNVS